MKCQFCDWSTLRWRTTKKGKRVEGYNSLLIHIEREHPEEFERVQSASLDADREMLGDDADFFEAAGIDNIGNK